MTTSKDVKKQGLDNPEEVEFWKQQWFLYFVIFLVLAVTFEATNKKTVENPPPTHEQVVLIKENLDLSLLSDYLGKNEMTLEECFTAYFELEGNLPLDEESMNSIGIVIIKRLDEGEVIREIYTNGKQALLQFHGTLNEGDTLFLEKYIGIAKPNLQENYFGPNLQYHPAQRSA